MTVLLVLTVLAVALIAVGLLCMLLAVSSAFVTMQERAETAETELAGILSELTKMSAAIDEQEGASVVVSTMTRPEGWYGMHES